MTMASVDELFEQAMKLPKEQRIELSDRLFQSALPEMPGDEVSPEEAEASWMEEVKRRLEQIDRGEVELKDAFESLEELRRQLHAERAANEAGQTPGR
jgi:hypothetical protein